MKTIISILFFFGIQIFTYAQERQDRLNDIQAYKISYLKEKLGLTLKEEKIFWPIYQSWQSEQAHLRKERREKMISFRKSAEIESLSDNEVQQLIQNELNFKRRDLDIENKYYYQLKNSLPIKTIGKYYRAQETFKRELLSRYRNGKKP